jgi:hypothetical protein
MRWLESLASTVHAWTIFILARGVLVQIPVRHIEEHRGPSIGRTPAPDTPLSPVRAEFLWSEQQSQSAHTDSMVKQLLTLSTALATVVFTLLDGALPWLRAPAIVGLLVSVLFCLQGLGVRRSSAPDTPHFADPNGDQQWAEDVVAATRYNRGGHAHRVDLYRAAWRWFVLALILAALAGLTRPPQTQARDTSSKSADSLSTRLQFEAAPAIPVMQSASSDSSCR